jgi:formiminotetrahydrofolate cyclodeaminase
MARFRDLTVSAFLDALASPEPTPGGGTAAAVAGAMGAGLLIMVAGLAKTRHDSDEDRGALTTARARLAALRDHLATLADTDSEAFNRVLAAYRLPAGTEAEKAARRQEIQHALRAATEAPMDTLRSSVEAIQHGRTVAAHGHRAAASDVRTALELLEGAAAGAVANVEANLTTLADQGWRDAAAAEARALADRMTAHLKAARAALG